MACDFLEQFDNVSINHEMKNKDTDANLPTHKLWVNKFLEKNNLDFLNYKELNEDAYEFFSRYENEWENTEFKFNSTKNYSFVTVSFFKI